MVRSSVVLAGVMCLLAVVAGPGGAAAGDAGAAKAPPTTNPADLKELRPGILAGYLPREEAIDSLALLGPPPDAGSAQQARDEAARLAALKQRDTPRARVAARDAVYSFPRAVDAFSCTIGVEINEKTTPHLNMLLRRTLTDAGLATYKAKNNYNRQRPYVAANDNGTCFADHEEGLRKDGSYPSGHAAFGWAWALILTEALPSEANAIIQRGYDFGQSRVICGYHWQSDVNAGRLVGAAVVAQLHANPDFEAQLAEAKKEIAAARASGAAKPDCALDDAAATAARASAGR
ncbi:phosphatase PAP2 family protein [Camelimonas fluminis]|uniref:Acid phosphatase n=1 Tax=Camelimonas fluminis TaxID=1576911 RepID=A0ABV7UPA4_9HYPH